MKTFGSTFIGGLFIVVCSISVVLSICTLIDFITSPQSHEYHYICDVKYPYIEMKSYGVFHFAYKSVELRMADKEIVEYCGDIPDEAEK